MMKHLKQADFAKRAADKKASRKCDVVAISKGASAKSLRERNFMFSGIDMAKVVAIAPNGHRFSRPK